MCERLTFQSQLYRSLSGATYTVSYYFFRTMPKKSVKTKSRFKDKVPKLERELKLIQSIVSQYDTVCFCIILIISVPFCT